MNSVAKRRTMKARKWTPKSMLHTIVDKKTVERIEKERQRLRKSATKFTKVDSYERAVGMYLSDPARKAVLFKHIETLCRIADRTGVTRDDKARAKFAIEMLEDVFLSGQYDKPLPRKK